jgi:hypothetical protein
MFSSFSKLISYPRLPLSFLKQQCSFASTSSSSKSDSTSKSTGDTYEQGKKDIHDPKIDASHQSGTKTKQERMQWEKKEQGFSSDIETRQERIPEDEKKNIKSKASKK